ncbi:hypothetical protein LJC03_03205 [Methanobrevibacter sp. OttesenSCG-928-I08]|nr:hypothetical protein [Methanobrevibacter sp. OttesenSCG-928-I08]
MNEEKDIRVLLSLVAVGIAIVAGTITFLNFTPVLSLLIIAIILFIFILLSNKKNISHLVENIEKVIFVITLIIIVSGFLLVYKPI